MDRSIHEVEVLVVDGGALRQPEPRPVRRRLIQSTLFAIGSQEEEAGDRGEGEECAGEESCGSQDKLKPRRAGNDVAAPRAVAAENGSPPAPGRRSGRRRLVQSMLVPHRSPDGENGGGEGGDREEEEESEGMEYCGSQRRRKQKNRGRGGNGVGSQTRASKKAAVDGKEPRSRKMDNNDCPALASSDFFVKVSDRQSHVTHQTVQKCRDSPEGNNIVRSPIDSMAENVKSPQQSKKQQGKRTPVKKSTLKHLPTSPLGNEHALPKIPDLRLEAKLSAEENSKLFAGRQIHPFFSSRKAGKTCREITEIVANSCVVEETDKSIPFGPIHVYDRVEEEAVTIDWRNWIFSDRNFSSANCCQEGAFSSLFEDCIESLKFDDFLSPLDLNSKPFENETFLANQCNSLALRNLQNVPAKVSSVLANGHMECLMHQKDAEMDSVDNAGISSAGNSNGFAVEGQIISPQERGIPICLGRSNQPENSLWTNKYLPEKATEVCGNGDAVKFLSDWLRLWHERSSRTRKHSDCSDIISQDNDYDCDGSESDSESSNKDLLQSVLLVTGPIGSGKSAAIYACAKEQGFQVLELNASDWRNGSLVKLRIGEALESHSLRWSLENSAGSQRKHFLKSLPGTSLSNFTAPKECENKVVDLIQLSDEEVSEDALDAYTKNHCLCDRGDKTLLLFEDVDITSTEDRGFVTAIQQLAETAKRPIVLTSNSNNPTLPDNLHRLQISFNIPSPSDLLCHLIMVCAAERSNIQPHLVKQFIKCCHGDIRKTIMNIQFWCQQGKGKEMQKSYSPLLFDIDAGHEILPKIIPWSLPSKLSELVEEEISKSLSMSEKNPVLAEEFDEEKIVDNDMLQLAEMWMNEQDNIEAKKEAMLSLNCPVHDGSGHISKIDASECPNSSDSPVAFARRNVRRKHETVLSSDSEDELDNGELPIDLNYPYVEADNEVYLNISSMSSSHCLATQIFPSPSSSKLYHNDGINGNNSHQFTETAIDEHAFFACKSVDISCVPESSIVPETELRDGRELMSGLISYGHDAVIVEADSANKSIQKPSNIEPNNIDNSVPGLLDEMVDMMGASRDMIADSSNGEAVGDSQNENVEAVTREYQMLDECSRMDFNRRVKSIQNLWSFLEADSVREAWRKLRGCESDLRQYVSSLEKDNSQIIDVAYKMSNLISEADLLLSDCQLLLCDILDPPMVPPEESNAFYCHEQQLHMSSATAQHGFCFYAKNIAAMQSNFGREQETNLIWEMLASTSNTMALGKLIGYTSEIGWPSFAGSSLDIGQPTKYSSLDCETSCLQNIVQSIVPSRSYFSLQGVARQEYLAFLGQMSRSETARLSESIRKTNKRRSCRADLHYLSEGAMMLSAADISLLGQYDRYWKSLSQLVNSARTLSSDNQFR